MAKKKKTWKEIQELANQNKENNNVSSTFSPQKTNYTYTPQTPINPVRQPMSTWDKVQANLEQPVTIDINTLNSVGQVTGGNMRNKAKVEIKPNTSLATGKIDKVSKAELEYDEAQKKKTERQQKEMKNAKTLPQKISTKTGQIFENVLQKPKALYDGFQVTDPLVMAGSTALSGVGHVTGGAFNAVNNLVQAGAYGISSVAGMTGHEDFAKRLRAATLAAKQDIQQAEQTGYNVLGEKSSVLGSTGANALEGVGQSTLFGVLSRLGVKPLSDVLTFAGGASGSFEEAYSKEDIEDWQAVLQASGSGAISWLTENFNDVSGYGGTKWSKALKEKGSQAVSTGLGKALLRLNISATSEAGEEIAENLFGKGWNYILNAITDMVGHGAKFDTEIDVENLVEDAATSWLSTWISEGSSVAVNNAVESNQIIRQQEAEQGRKLSVEEKNQIKKDTLLKSENRIANQELIEESKLTDEQKQSLMEVANQYELSKEEVKKAIKDTLDGKYDTNEDRDKIINESDLNDEEKASLTRVANNMNLTNKQVKSMIENKANLEDSNKRYQTYNESASKFNIDTNNEAVKAIFNVANRRDVGIEYSTTYKDSNGQDIEFTDTENAVHVVEENGKRTIVINPNAKTDKTLENLIVHEITHDMEGTKEYSKLANLLFDGAKKIKGNQQAYQSIYDSYANFYKNKGINKSKAELDEIARSEFVANTLGDQIGNEEFISYLMDNTEKTTMQKFIDAIGNIINRLTGYKDQERYWREVQDKYKKAYQVKYGSQKANSKYSFGGENAKTANIKTLKEAKNLKKQGLSNEEIYKQTGWYEGSEGKWRFEIDNSKDNLKFDFKDIEEHYKNNSPYDEIVKNIEEVLDANDLYEAYPELKDVVLKFDLMDKAKALAYVEQYSNGELANNVIHVTNQGITSIQENPEKLKSYILHELQHRIQVAEGFANGADFIEWYNYKTDDIRKRLNKIVEKHINKELKQNDAEHIWDVKDEFVRNYLYELEGLAGKSMNQYFKDPESFELNYVQKRGLESTLGQKDTQKFYEILDEMKEYRDYGKAMELYRNTAGEIEAREVQDRMDMTPEERAGKLPFIKDENTVFSEEMRGKSKKSKVSYSISTKDSNGRELTKEQQEFFKDVSPELRDNEGNIKTYYHGTEANVGIPQEYWFSIFDEGKQGNNGSWFGNGFYFTEDEEHAKDYAHTKGNVYEVYLNIKNPYIPYKNGNSMVSFQEDFKNNFEEAKNIEGKLTGKQISDILKNNGYDGIVIGDNAVAFYSNQIKNIDNTNPTTNPDIRYSVETKTDNDGNKLTIAQRNYFKGSKAVDENGNLVKVYHTMTDAGKQFNEFNPVGTPYYRFGDQTVNYYTDNLDMSGSYAGNDYLDADTTRYTTIKQLEDRLNNINLVNGTKFKLENRNGIYGIYNENETELYNKAKEFYQSLNDKEKEIINNLNNVNFSDLFYEDEYGSKDDNYYNVLNKYKNWVNEMDKLYPYERTYGGVQNINTPQSYLSQGLKEFNPFSGDGTTPRFTYETEEELYKNLIPDIMGNNNYQYEGYINLQNPYIVDAKGQDWQHVEFNIPEEYERVIDNISKLNQKELTSKLDDAIQKANEKDSDVNSNYTSYSNSYNKFMQEAGFKKQDLMRGLEEIYKDWMTNIARGEILDLYALDLSSGKATQVLQKIAPYEVEHSQKDLETYNQKYKQDLLKLANENITHDGKSMKIQDFLFGLDHALLDQRTIFRNPNYHFEQALKENLLNGYSDELIKEFAKALKETHSYLKFSERSNTNWSVDDIKESIRDNLSNYNSSVTNNKTELGWFTTNDVVKKVIEMNKKGSNYDGLIMKNVVDYGHDIGKRDPGNLFVTFDSNQFKAADNKNPTSNPDIRYSVETEQFDKTLAERYPEPTTKANNGVSLTKSQQNFFKNSKARSLENGGLVNVFHTMTNAGKPFFEFNPVGTDYYRFGSQVVNYFTDDKNMSGSYAGQDYKEVNTKKITTVKQAEQVLKDYYEYKDGIELKLVENPDGSYDAKLWVSDGSLEPGTTVRSYANKNDLIKNALDSVTSDMSKYMYSGYVNIQNPYVVNAEGRNWNMVEAESNDFIDELDERVPEEVKENLHRLYRKSADISAESRQKYTDLDLIVSELDNRQDIDENVHKLNHILFQNFGLINNINDVINNNEWALSDNDWRQLGFALWNGQAINDAQRDEIIERQHIPENIRQWLTETLNKDIFKETKRNARTLQELHNNKTQAYRDFDKYRYPADYFIETIMGEPDNEDFVDIGQDLSEMLELRAEMRGYEEVAYEIAQAASVRFSKPQLIRIWGTSKTTNDIVKQVIEYNNSLLKGDTTRNRTPEEILKAGGYDGVIFRNVVDYGGKSDTNAPHDVYVTFSSNQFKATDNKTPTKNPDIRYSNQTSDTWQEFMDRWHKNTGKGTKLKDAKLPQKQEVKLPVKPKEKTPNFDDLDDVFSEIGEDSVESPLKDRNIETIGKETKTNAYQYENPEVKPYFQEMAQMMGEDLGFIADSSNKKTKKGGGSVLLSNTEAIDDLHNKFGYSYEQIAKGLNNIINDEGTENNAVSKKIEFYLDDALRNGYRNIYGKVIEPNQDYINTIQPSIDINESKLPNAQKIEEFNKTTKEEDLQAIRNNSVQNTNPEITPETVDEGVEKDTLKYLVEGRTQQKMKNLKDEFLQKFVNKGHYIDKLAKKTGDKDLTYKYDRMLSSFAEAQVSIGDEHVIRVNGVNQTVGKSLNDIYKPAEEAGLENEFNDYLLNRHNIDRYAYEKGVYGREVSAQDSRKNVEKYEREHPIFKEWAEEVYRYNRYEIQGLVNAGIISQEFYNKLVDMYGSYVPTFRDIQEMHEELVGEGTVGHNVIKKATGSKKPIISPKLAMAEQTIAFRKAIATNEVGKELYKILGKDSKVFEGLNFDNLSIESIGGNVIEKAKDGFNTFTIFNKGQATQFKISDDLYTAFDKNTLIQKVNNNELASALLTPVEKLTKKQRNLLTTYSIGFAFNNPLKDYQDALYNTKYTAPEFAKNYTVALHEIATNGKFYQDAKRNGLGANTYYDFKSGILPETKNKLKMVGNKIQDANQIIELAPRLAEYITTLEHGGSVDEALYNAAEITTNFKRGGDITKFVNKYGANFVNASIQGLDKQIRNITENNSPKGYARLLFRAVALGVLPSIINHLLLDDDDDYQDLPDYIKDSYYLLPSKNEGEFYRIPKGRVLAVIGATARRTIELAQGESDAFDDYWKEVWGNNLAPNNPLTDNLISPIKQALDNKAWYDGEIVSARLQKKPKAEQSDERTDKISKFVGESIGKLPQGTRESIEKIPVLGDLFSIVESPKLLNYVLDQYSGGVGDAVLPHLTPFAEDSMLANKFTTNAILKNKNVEAFYEALENAETMNNSDYATDSDKLAYKYLSGVSKDVGSLYSDKKEIQNDNTLKDKEKKAKTLEIQKEINKQVEEALEKLNEMKLDNDYASFDGTEYYKNNKGEWEKIDNEDVATGLSNQTYADYKSKSQQALSEKKKRENKDNAQLNDKEKISLVLSSSYTNKEKDLIYDNYIRNDSDNDYAAYKLLNGIDNIDDYLNYKSADFTSDKIDDGSVKGKSVKTSDPGSKKNKFNNYIENSNFDAITRLYLYGTEYKFNKTERDTFEEMLNQRNLTPEQKKQIYLTLNGVVEMKDGSIEWK